MKEIKKNNYSQFVIRNLARYGLSALLGIVLIGESVSAIPKNTGVEIAQQQAVDNKEPIRKQAEKLTDEGFKLFKQGTAESSKQAIAKWEESLPLWRKVGDKGWEANILLGIGRVYSNLGDKQQALKYYKQALPLSRQIKNKHGEATTLNNIGSIYDDLGNKQLALKYYNQALPIRRKIQDKSGEAVILNNIGGVYSDLGDNQQALKFLNQALVLKRKIQDKSGEATSLNNIGSVYSDLGDKQQALKFYKQALLLSREFKDKRGEATSLNNIGAVYNALGDKPQALKFFNQALPLRREFADKSGEATTINNIGGVYSDLGDKQQALKFFNQALPLMRSVGNKSGEAATLSNIGGVHWSLGDNQQALKFHSQALLIHQEIEDKSGEATTLGNIGTVHGSLGNSQQALKFFNQALVISQEIGVKSGEATTINNIGHIYDLLGDKQQALKLYNQALLLRREIRDKSGEAGSLNDIATVYIELGDKHKALNLLNQALILRRQVGDKGGEATTLNNIALVYSDLGDYQKALNFFNQALPLSREVGDKTQEATTLSNIGVIYNNLGDKQRALDLFNQALLLSRKVGHKSGEAAYLNNIGAVYDDLGDKQQALKFYNQALPLSRKIGYKSVRAKTLNNIGKLYFDLKNNQQALKNYNQSLPLSQEVGDKTQEATTLSNIGKIYNLSGNNQQALKFYNKALPLSREAEDKRLQAIILRNIATTYKEQGNLQTALTNSKAAVDIIENLRTKVDSNELRTSYFATVQDIYKLHIDILMQLHLSNPSLGYDAQALAANEKSRARGLLELLTEARADIRKGANPQLLAEESRLQQLISAKEKLRLSIVNDKNKSNDLISKNAAQKLKKEIKNHLNEYKQLQVQIKQSNPKYANIKYPEPLKLPQIQQQLDKDSLLLQYSLGEDRSYLWLVSSNSLDVYELPKKSEIEKASINLFCLISQNSSKPPDATGKENPCENTENIKTRRIDLAAEELSKLALAPVKDKLGKKRLIVVADGALQYIPFAALADLTSNSLPKAGNGEKEKDKLPFPRRRGAGGEVTQERGIDVTPNPASGNSFNYQPLLVNHEIINLPSASAIAIQRQELANRKTAPKTLAILADPVFSATDKRVINQAENKQLNKQSSLDLELERSALNRSTDTFNRQGWAQLEGTRREAETLLQLVPDGDRSAVFDFDANYNWATGNSLNQFRILHFATHGFVNDENPELSGIVLSLVDKQGKDIRGYLRLGDLFNLDYPADLIVLSACETGLGKDIQGEGLVGLTRGLMYAGAERLVVSLWQVDDRGTAVFMQEFYQEMLQNGKSASEALRATQLKMWNQEKWRNPNYWAAFAFLGEWK